MKDLCKKELRSEIRGEIKKLTRDYTKKASEEIADAFLSLPEYRECKSIFIYISSPFEPDTAEIIKRALEDKKAVYVPKCIAKGEMLAVKITEDTIFTSGYMDIKEPVTDENTFILRCSPDLTVVPCMSASADGKRLGHGAGFYDRFLAKHPSFTVCLCFSELIREDIPTEKTDIIMDKVLSDKT